MLVDFSVANFGPFRERATISMVPSALSDKEGAVIDSCGFKGGLLKVAVVFGPNASGKSFFFDAVRCLKEVVSTIRPEDSEMPGYSPFRLSSECLSAPVEMEIRLVADGTLYDYSVAFVRDRIVSESLSHSPNGRVARVFSRGAAGDHMSPQIAERLTGASSYLYLAASYNDSVCNKVLKEISGIEVIRQPSDRSLSASYYAAAGDPDIRAMMESALDAADLGIRGFVGEERMLPAHSQTGVPRKSMDLQFIHSFDEADVDEGMLSFPFDIESSGTLELFAVMGPIAAALKDGGTVLIDEFGSDLHPMLTRWVVDLFNNEENDNGAQLLVNTHDMGLMDVDGFMRRDEIWFTRKDRRRGSCSLFSLSDFKGVRKGSDVRKDYLWGRYDGVPVVVGVRKL